MLVVQTVPTTPRLDELIYMVAALTRGKNSGYVKHSAQGGETFIYNTSEEFMTLRREYFDNLWGAVQRAVTGVKLEEPKRRPIALNLKKGRLVISPDDVGVIIPFRSLDDTFEEDNLDIKSGDDHHNATLAPHTIIVLYDDKSKDVSIKIPARIPFDLILHPKSPPNSTRRVGHLATS